MGLKRVLVVGGGIGGVACAIALRRRGIAVDLIERDPDWKVYGAGLTITGPTLRAFRDLGLFEPIAQSGYFALGGHMFLFDGTLLSKETAEPIEPELPSSGGIMRPKLQRIMAEAAIELNTNVRVGLTVQSIRQDLDGVDVTFSDDSSGRYELVVGADGIYSQLRGYLFGEAASTPVYSGQMSWRVVASRPPNLNVSQFYFGHQRVGGVTPCSATEVYAYVLHPEPQPRRVPDEDKLSFVREIMSHFGGFMGEIRDAMTEGSLIVQRPFEYLFQHSKWHQGRVVLIGDAAHATTPHLASGAGMAVEDALVLTEELCRAHDVPTALRAFQDRRYDRCKYVVDSSAAIARRQLENAPPDEIGMRMKNAMQRLAEPI